MKNRTRMLTLFGLFSMAFPCYGTYEYIKQRITDQLINDPCVINVDEGAEFLGGAFQGQAATDCVETMQTKAVSLIAEINRLEVQREAVLRAEQYEANARQLTREYEENIKRLSTDLANQVSSIQYDVTELQKIAGPLDLLTDVTTAIDDIKRQLVAIQQSTSSLSLDEGTERALKRLTCALAGHGNVEDCSLGSTTGGNGLNEDQVTQLITMHLKNHHPSSTGVTEEQFKTWIDEELQERGVNWGQVKILLERRGLLKGDNIPQYRITATVEVDGKAADADALSNLQQLKYYKVVLAYEKCQPSDANNPCSDDAAAPYQTLRRFSSPPSAEDLYLYESPKLLLEGPKVSRHQAIYHVAATAPLENAHLRAGMSGIGLFSDIKTINMTFSEDGHSMPDYFVFAWDWVSHNRVLTGFGALVVFLSNIDKLWKMITSSIGRLTKFWAREKKAPITRSKAAKAAEGD